jgi:dephospho-CoA kinase
MTDLGASVFDCDDYVHELYRPAGAATSEVVRLFGDRLLDSRGAVDRKALADLVLGDPAARSKLEGVVHPLVRNGVEQWLAELGSDTIAVIEAALLVETGWWCRYRLLVVVWCSADQQLQRARARGIPDERARGLLAAQLPLEEKLELADVVIDNSGAREELDPEVGRAWSRIVSLCEER